MGKTPEQIAEGKIESQLVEQGWEEIDSDSSETGYSKYVVLPNGKEADYVLYINGQAVAIIEAKEESKRAKSHLQQARNYAKAIDDSRKYKGTYSVPFVFASNGNEIAIDDLREGTPGVRAVASFYSPNDISRKLSQNVETSLDWLDSHNYEDTDKELWENQISAMENIKEAILNKRYKILLSMATGSGKTRLAMALTYQLLESGYAGRVLFLTDTEQLERDGLQAFQTYDPLGAPRFSDRYIVRDFDEFRSKGADVVVSTIQKAYYELKENPENFSIGEFDVIIADECHRFLYNEEEGYGRVLDFYDSVEIGLTATPHKKTLQRYNNNHVFDYGYHEALSDDKVVPFRPFVVQTEATMDGIVYEGTDYSPSDFGRNVLIHDTHRKVAKEIVKIADIENDLTLVFAQNIDHAHVITEDFREVFSEELQIDNPEEFVKTITSENRHSDDALIDFKDKRRNPRVAVTVDMISTGVDVRPLNNLVFLRAVKSSILYNQMVGRGTRNTPEKEFFRLFDCIGVLDYHSDNMFSTENLDIQYTDSERAKDPTPTDNPVEIEERDIDKVVNQYQAYPLENGFVNESKFIAELSAVIRNNEKEIEQAVDEGKSIEEIDSKIEEILSNEWQYYNQDYILDASPQHIDSLFELSLEVIAGHNFLRENAERGKQAILDKYNLTAEQEEWIDMIVERAVIGKKAISKRQLLEKPFSDHGGYDRAKSLFQGPGLDTVLSEFNQYLLSLPSDRKQ